MTYRRFHLETAVATVATVATVSAPSARSVASVATVAALNVGNQGFDTQSVANVATVAEFSGNCEKSAQTVPPAEIAIEIERAAARLKSAGTPLDCIAERATAMVRANLRNDPRLCERQPDPRFCHVCAHRADPDRPLLPISTAEPGRHHWLHSDCWPEHVRRIRARIDALMAGAAPG